MSMMDWRFTQAPVRKAAAIDFRARALASGPALGTVFEQDTLCSVEGSPGDWTLYVIRQIPDTFDAFANVTELRDVHVMVGYGEAQDEQLVETINNTGAAFSAWGGRNRAQMWHFHGSTVQARVSWRKLTTAPRELDRLVAWVSPGRPARYEVPFIATLEQPVIPAFTVVDPPMRIPLFATSLRVYGNALDFATPALAAPLPFYCCWFDWADTPTAIGPGATLASPGMDIAIPSDARFVRFVRQVGAPPLGPDFCSGVFVCRS